MNKWTKIIVVQCLILAGLLFSILFVFQKNTTVNDQQPELIFEVLPKVQLLISLLDEEPKPFLIKEIKDKTLKQFTDELKAVNETYSNDIIIGEFVLKESYISKQCYSFETDKSFKKLFKLVDKIYKETNYIKNHYNKAQHQKTLYHLKENLGLDAFRWIKEFTGDQLECNNFIVIPGDHASKLSSLHIKDEEGTYMVHILFLNEKSKVNYTSYRFIEEYLLDRMKDPMTKQLSSKDYGFLWAYYYPVSKNMKEKGINTLDDYINQVFCKSATALYLKSNYEQNAHMNYLTYQQDQGFFMLEDSLQILENYHNQTSKESLNTYLQQYLEQLEDQVNESIATYYSLHPANK